jgi:hypothetical protein
MLETMRRLYPRGAASRGICGDGDGATLGPDCILVRRTADGYRCAAPDDARVIQSLVLTQQDDPDWLFYQCCRISEALGKGEIALAQIYGLHIPVDELDESLLDRLALASPLSKANFNPDEPRLPKGEPGAGQWTGDGTGSPGGSGAGAGGADGSGDDGGGGGAAGGGGDAGPGGAGGSDTVPVVGTVAAVDAAAASPLLGDVAPRTLAALARLAARMSGATAFFGTLFIPDNRSMLSESSFEGRPDLAYSYDRDTGVLRITQGDGSGDRVLLAEGHIDAEGMFRDSTGRAIGRALPGGSVIVDPDTLPGYLARPGTAAPARTVAGVQAESDIANEPKLCPDPSFDHPGARAKDIAYQQYVSILVNGRALPPGLAVSLWNPVSERFVAFDDCRLSDGTMIDAKGTGYLDQLKHGTMAYPWLGIQAKMITQAASQVVAAGGRTIEWHFAESEVADVVRSLFEQEDIRVRVIYTPWRR